MEYDDAFQRSLDSVRQETLTLALERPVVLSEVTLSEVVPPLQVNVDETMAPLSSLCAEVPQAIVVGALVGAAVGPLYAPLQSPTADWGCDSEVVSHDCAWRPGPPVIYQPRVAEVAPSAPRNHLVFPLPKGGYSRV